SGAAGLIISGTSSNSNGTSAYTNSNGEFLVSGNIANAGPALNITNSGSGLRISKTGTVNNVGNLEMTNTGANGLKIAGTSSNTNGTSTYTNSAGELLVSGTINGNGPKLTVTNTGSGLRISKTGTVNNIGDLEMTNTGKNGLKIAGTSSNANGTSIYTNEKGALTVNGTVSNNGPSLTLTNTGSGLNINNTGIITNTGDLNMSNTGAKGLNIAGTVTNTGKALISNSGAGGINLESSGSITNDKKLTISNTGTQGINIQGLIKANGVSLNSKNSDIKIGDNTANDNYVISGGDINIDIKNGSLLNAGFDKTLLSTTSNKGNLIINAVNGKIGEDLDPALAVGPDARDFEKSINVSGFNRVDADASGSSSAVNIASKDSDLRVGTIRTDGRVILTADYGKDGKAYSILNGKDTADGKANIEGKGINLIASRNIGLPDDKITFNQTDAVNHTMDVLAMRNINIKGLDDAYDTNVGTMISREGNINAEFSGNTIISEITAAKDINLVARGAEMRIDHLGEIVSSVHKDGDYYGENASIVPQTVTAKVLDINSRTRVAAPDPDSNGYIRWADSQLTIGSGRVNGDITLTADNIYVNGMYYSRGKAGFSEVPDSRTLAFNAGGKLTAQAVKASDVTAIGRDEKERNYYSSGSGGGDDPGGGGGDDPGGGGGDDPGGGGDDPDLDDDPDRNSDNVWKRTWKERVVDENVQSIDKRQYMRFEVNGNRNPVTIENNTAIDRIVDISRGGMAVEHHKTLKRGDVVPVKVLYGDLDIEADVKVLAATNSSAHTQFINIDKATANKLLYLNILLEKSETAYRASQNDLSYGKN
ncbi:MAG: PilZ domain-containing protein, partial [Heliobacteriaceae bacterium]|nr:PilZ domain-containing protein [Heliobacteriaceae bacterium]